MTTYLLVSNMIIEDSDPWGWGVVAGQQQWEMRSWDMEWDTTYYISHLSHTSTDWQEKKYLCSLIDFIIIVVLNFIDDYLEQKPLQWLTCTLPNRVLYTHIWYILHLLIFTSSLLELHLWFFKSLQIEKTKALVCRKASNKSAEECKNAEVMHDELILRQLYLITWYLIQEESIRPVASILSKSGRIRSHVEETG